MAEDYSLCAITYALCFCEFIFILKKCTVLNVQTKP